MDNQLQSFDEQSVIQEYLRTLFNQGYKKEFEDTKNLLEYIELMEKQYQQISMELNEMKELLKNLQVPIHQSRLSVFFERIDVSISEGKQKLNELKENMLVSMKKSLSELKSKGKDGVIKIIDMTHFKGMVQGIRKSLFVGMHKSKDLIRTSDLISAELRQSGNHMRNIGRLLVGKPIHKNETEQHKLNLFQVSSRKLQSSFEGMFCKTTQLLHKLENFEKKSVKHEIKQIAHKEKKKPKETDLNMIR